MPVVTVEERLKFLEEQNADLQERMKKREEDDRIARNTIALILNAIKKRDMLIEI